MIMQSVSEKINYYIHHRNEREQQIMDILTNNRNQQFSEKDLVEMIYVDTPEKLLKAAEYNVNHHLMKLSKENRVTQFNNLWQINDASKL